MGGCNSNELNDSENVDRSTVREEDISPIVSPQVNLKILVVGSMGAGKSCFVNRFLEKKYNESIGHTIGVDCGRRIIPKHGMILKVTVWDCSGNKELHSVITGYFRHAHGVLICYDLCDEKSLEEAKSWVLEIKEKAHPGTCFLFAGLKSDSKLAQGRLQELATLAASSFGACGSFATSAKSGAGIEEAFSTLIEAIGSINNNKMKGKHQQQQPNESTGILNGKPRQASCVLL